MLASLGAGIGQDFRHACRTLRNTPGILAIAVLTLGVGIGATTAIFSVVNTVLLNPLPYREPDRLVTAWESDPRHGHAQIEISYGNLDEWRRRNQVFEGLAGITSVNLDFALTGSGGPQQVEGVVVSPDFFDVLGTRPALGRGFADSDVKDGAPAVAVISHRLWRTRYGADRSVLGRSVRVDGTACTIAGVMPAGFDFPRGADLWFPLGLSPAELRQYRHLRVLRAVARLKPGVSQQQAEQSMNALAAELEQIYPVQNAGYRVRLTSMSEAMFGDARSALMVLMAAVLFVLLIACTNVGNLLLARAAGRRREMAVRCALGAGRARLARQLLIEAGVLSACGALTGIAIAYGIVQAVAVLAPPDVPRIEAVRVDGVALAAAALLALATSVLAGLAPVWDAVRTGIQPALSSSTRRSSASAGRARLRDALAAAEIAMAVLLSIGGGLLIRSFYNFLAVDVGYRTANVLTFRITLPQPKYAEQDARKAFYQAVLDRVRAMPGVDSAAAVLLRPLSGTVGWDYDYTIEGQTPEEQARNPHSNYEAISPDYFRSLGIGMVDGRAFERGDGPKAPGVAIVGESFAARYWPGRSAVGRRLKIGRPDGKRDWLTVVGVARDAHYREWKTARLDLYVPFQQHAEHRSDFVVRTSVPPLTLAAAVRRAVDDIDKDQPVSSITTMDGLAAEALARPRFSATLVTAFGLCAALLAVVGVYGVVSYASAARTSEFGIRMALGSSRAALCGLVLRGGLRLTLMGAAAGTLCALAATQLLSGLLFGVPAADPLVYLIAAAILGASSMAACLAPALRAARTDPMRALQHE